MKWNLKHIVLLVIYFILTPGLSSQKDLNDIIDNHLSHPNVAYANVSVCAYDIASGEKLVDHRSKKGMTPASSLKLLTSLTALDLFGPEYQFETRITYDGQIMADGTLKGNLYVEGGGDPTLGFERIQPALKLKELMGYISSEIRAAGINCIDGNIIADESIFDSYPISPSWQWDDLGNYYASGAWGLNVHENTYYIYFKDRSVVGNRPTISGHEPRIPDLQLSNEVVVDSAGTGDNAYVFGGPYDYLKRISGTIPAGNKTFRIKAAIPNPPLFFIQQLAQRLEKDNVQSQELETQFRPKASAKKRKLITTIQSPSLGKIVQFTNNQSLNLHAEALFKIISLKQSTTASGSRAIRYMKQQMRKKGIDITGMHIADGSGLSARNTISSEVLSAFVMHQAREHTPEQLSTYIPTVGAEGTVRNLYLKPALRNKVWLKSGSMNRVLSYTGIMKNQQGKWISISLIFNGFHTKHAQIREIVSRILSDIYSKS